MKAKATEIWNLVQGGWIIELQKFKSLAYRRTTPADALAAASESRDVTCILDYYCSNQLSLYQKNGNKCYDSKQQSDSPSNQNSLHQYPVKHIDGYKD